MKTLSICIPTYNRKEKLMKLMRSIIAQRNERMEICVSDNGSTDGTKEYLNELKQMFGIKINLHEKNKGFDENLLAATELAKGKYIWFMGDDEEVREGGISTMLDFIEENHPFRPPAILLDYPKTENEEIIRNPQGFMSFILISREALSEVKPRWVRMGIGTQYIHRWILRLVVMEWEGLKVITRTSEGIVIPGYSQEWTLFSQQLLFAKSAIKEYKEFMKISWELTKNPRTGINKNHPYAKRKTYLSFATKKLIGAFFFPAFHVICERAFRKEKEMVWLFEFTDSLGEYGGGLYLFREAIWRLPEPISRALFHGCMVIANKGKLTGNTDTEHWARFWGEVSV